MPIIDIILLAKKSRTLVYLSRNLII